MKNSAFLDAIICADEHQRIRLFDDAAQTMFGLAQAQAIGQPLSTLIPERLRAAQENILRELLRSQSPARVVPASEGMLAVRADGQEFPIEMFLCHSSAKGNKAITVMVRDCTQLRKAQSQLRDGEERFRLAVAATQDAIWDADLIKGSFWWNETYDRLYGTPEPTAHAAWRWWQERLHPEDREWVVSSLDEARRGTAEKWTAEYRFRDIRGEWAYIFNRAYIARDANGGALRILGAMQNLTERKRAEDALRESEHRLRLASSAAQLGVFEWDMFTDRAHWANERMYEIFGRTRAQGPLSSSEFAKIVEPEDWLHFETMLREPVQLDRLFHAMCRVRRESDGQQRWLEFSGHFELSHDGKIKRVVGVVADITERQRTEEALRRSEERFRQLAEAMPQLVWTALRDGTVTYYNARAKELDGINRDGEGNWRWQPVLHPDDLKTTTEAWQNAVASGQMYQCEHRVRMASGAFRWHLSRAVPVRDESGNVVKWFGTATDIHDLKLAQEALREADQRKNEFLATLAHELRNPLAPIRNAVHILKLQNQPDPALQTARDMIERQLQHMVRLIDDLLDISRITSGKLQLRKEHIDLAAVLRQAIDASKPLIESARHELRVKLPSTPVYLDADPVRIIQVFQNLLNNASKYSGKGGSISVSAQCVSGKAVVKVADKGIGIPSEHLPHLFDMFSQWSPDLEYSQGGLGIGLSLTRSLVEMHGGRIDAHSEGPGKGSEFIVRLPTVAEAPHHKAAETIDERTALRILIVDDNRDIVESLAMVLQLRGNDVQTAFDGVQAVEVAQRYRPDVVLLDIGMPKQDGYTTCRQIREQPWGKSMTIVAMTGWGQDEDRIKSKEAGFDDHLVKPVDPVALVNLLANLPHNSETKAVTKKKRQTK